MYAPIEWDKEVVIDTDDVNRVHLDLNL